MSPVDRIGSQRSLIELEEALLFRQQERLFAGITPQIDWSTAAQYNNYYSPFSGGASILPGGGCIPPPYYPGSGGCFPGSQDVDLQEMVGQLMQLCMMMQMQGPEAAQSPEFMMALMGLASIMNEFAMMCGGIGPQNQMDPISAQVASMYHQELGMELDPEQLEQISEKIRTGELTFSGLKDLLQEARGLIMNNPDPSAEWHGRDFDIAQLREEFGLAGGGSIDGFSDDDTRESYLERLEQGGGQGAEYPDGAAGDGQSIAGQATRLLRLAELIEQGILPEGRLNIEGDFTHYKDGLEDSDYFYANTPYFEGESGGSWDDIISLVPEGASDEEASRAIYDWYATRWGRNFHIDMDCATAADLRAAAEQIYRSGASTGSPIAFDLNGDNQIGTTGVSTAQDRVDGQVGQTVEFDLDGDGELDNIEWLSGNGDGLLVDDSDGGATQASQGNGRIDGRRLFGDQGGAYANGYEKLALRDQNHDGKLSGTELDGLKVWVDDGDAKVEAGELKSLRELGITEISAQMRGVTNERGETLMRSTYTQDGQTRTSEDVWFAEQQQAPEQQAPERPRAAPRSRHRRRARRADARRP